jgi:hypothetical protein
LPLESFNNKSNYLIKNLNSLTLADSKFKIIKFSEKVVFHVNDPSDSLEFKVFRTKDASSVQLEKDLKLRDILKLSDFEIILQGKIDCCNFMNRLCKENYYGIKLEREKINEKNEETHRNIDINKLEVIFLFIQTKFYFPLQSKSSAILPKKNQIPLTKNKINGGVLILKIENFRKINENDKFIIGHSFSFDELKKENLKINQIEKTQLLRGNLNNETKVQLKRTECRFDENLIINLKQGENENLFFQHNSILWKTLPDSSQNQNFIKYLNYMDIKSYLNVIELGKLGIYENERAQISLEIM